MTTPPESRGARSKARARAGPGRLRRRRADRPRARPRGPRDAAPAGDLVTGEGCRPRRGGAPPARGPGGGECQDTGAPRADPLSPRPASAPLAPRRGRTGAEGSAGAEPPGATRSGPFAFLPRSAERPSRWVGGGGPRAPELHSPASPVRTEPRGAAPSDSPALANWTQPAGLGRGKGGVPCERGPRSGVPRRTRAQGEDKTPQATGGTYQEGCQFPGGPVPDPTGSPAARSPRRGGRVALGATGEMGSTLPSALPRSTREAAGPGQGSSETRPARER